MGTRFGIACVVAAGSLLAAAPSLASCTSATYGTTTYFGCSDGTTGMSLSAGGATFHQLGTRTGVSIPAGDATYHALDGLTGASRRIGETTYHMLGRETGSSRTVGETTFHEMGGRTGTSRRFGRTTYSDGPLFGREDANLRP
jgi:hypothetical protein